MRPARRRPAALPAAARGRFHQPFLHAALEASRTGVCLFDDGGGVRFCNSAFRALLGFGAEDEVTWASFGERVGGAAEPGRAICIRRPGDRFVSVRLAAVETGGLLASVDDVTLQQRERSARDRFLAEVVDAQERSSREIAELLHEDALQQLTALGLQLDLAAELAGSESLREMARRAGDVTRSLRSLVVQLHPAVLESQGLAAAIEMTAESLRVQGIAVGVSAFDERLPHETELVAYRLVQEALVNVLRHARAANVDVELAVADGVLRCRVVDDGAGFDPRSLGEGDRHRRLGLHLVRERVEMAGGRHRVESEPGRGTTVSFELPVARAGDRAEPLAGEVAR